MKTTALMALLALSFAAPTPAHAALSQGEMVKLLGQIDDRQRNTGDWKGLAFIKQKDKDKEDVVYEMVYYRRDEDDKIMILFLKPKSEAGKGYLRSDDNLWLYDPGVGKWERRTERERIAGTDSRRADFDESRLAKEYDPAYLGEETLGKFPVHRLRLKAKPGSDVAWPLIELSVDKATGNVLKRQEFALSGKLMRTSYYPTWQKVYSESKQAEVWYPKQMRFYDEVEKGNSTLVLIKQIDLRALPKNIFTKAWLESKSR
jgi:outer membrane lipoprotein-sorting protein